MKNNKKQHKNKLSEHPLVRRPAYVRPSLRGAPTTSTTLAKAEPQGTLQQVGREADAAWAGVKRIMSLLNVEFKHVYYNAVGNNISSAGSLLDLCSLISQGVGGSQRVGDSLKVRRCRIKVIVTHNAAATQPQAFTMVLGHSKDGVPAVADVFAIVGGTASGLAFPSDTFNEADHWSESKTSYVSSTDVSKVLSFDVPFNHDVLYTNGTAVTSSGNVWFAYISNEPTNFPTFSIGMDLEFVDN
jgi:hypothetical protein